MTSKFQYTLLLGAFFMLLTSSVSGQKEANWWYFGNKAGVNFNTTPPTTYSNGAINALEGVASIAHRTTGQLLFYTDGKQVWNRNHQQMTNGFGLLGNATSSHSAVAVPDPGNANRYYIFTVPYPPSQGSRYTLVDMTLNSGLGDVVSTTKNVRLGTHPVADKIAAQTHSNGRDVWVLFQHENSWDFYAYLVTSTGVTTTPVISTVTNPTGTLPVQHYGCSKISPDGKKMVAVHGNRDAVLVFDFNTTTGVLSNQISMILSQRSQPYGVEFSVDSKLFYIGNGDSVLQFDPYAGTTAGAIYNSKYVLRHSKGRVGQIQLGPDEKIYICNTSSISIPSSRILSVIQSPNSTGAACNYKDTGLVIPSGANCRYGLPTFIQSFFNKTVLLVEDACDSQFVKISVKDTSAVDSVFYDYGDTASATNSSWNKLDSHMFSGPGNYVVTAYPYYWDSKKKVVVKDTLTDTVKIIQPPIIVLPGDTTICISDSIKAKVINKHFASPFEQQWHDSTTGDWYTIDTIGQYYITARNRCGVTSDTIQVDSLFKRELSLGRDTIFCLGDSIILDASDTAASYKWNTGDTTSQIIVKTTGLYWAESQNLCGVFRDTMDVEVIAPPITTITPDTSFCGDLYPWIFVGEKGPSKHSSYFWSNNTNGHQTWAATGLYILRETNKCGTDIDSVYVREEFNLGQSLIDTFLCDDDSILIDPYTNGAECIWNNDVNLRDSTFLATQAGTYWVYATNACGTMKDSIEIIHRTTPNVDLPQDTVICDGDSVALEVSWPFSTYLWHDGSTVSRFWAKTRGPHTVVVTTACGTDGASINIGVDENPTVFLPEDTVICDDDEFTISATGNFIRSMKWNTGNLTMNQLIRDGGIYEIQVSNDCGNASDQIEIIPRKSPVVNIGADTTICNGDEIELRTYIPEEILDYTSVIWNERYNAKELYVTRDDWYRVLAENICGFDMDTVRVKVRASPRLDLPKDTVVCDDFLIFDFEETGYKLSWSDGNEESQYKIVAPGEYGVEIWDELGCYGSQLMTVKECASKLWVPKAFTPNFDQHNESFRAFKDGLTFYQIDIYDRWNNLVFSTNNIAEGWDGTVMNEGDNRCPIGEYTWKIQFTEEANNQLQVVTGAVSLVR